MEPWAVVVIIGILCVVFSWFVKEQGAPHSSASEIEDALDLVSANLEEENRRLLEAMSGMKKEYALRAEAWEDKASELEAQVRELSAQVQSLSAARTAQPAPAAFPEAAHPAQAASEPGLEAGQAHDLSEAFRRRHSELKQPESPRPHEPAADAKPAAAGSIRERYPELFRLDAQGQSIEQIARRAGLSKGEAALILQLARQEEEGHA